jgi:CxxC-x17-CxxC domain-containing protein
MEFQDKEITCVDCAEIFIFTAGEQLFFYDKHFQNEPKRCKGCKAKRASQLRFSGERTGHVRVETRTTCNNCGKPTTVPFKPTQGRPVLCRVCFQKERPMSATA